MAETQYQRLTRQRTAGGFAVAVAVRSSLWLGDDHLLVAEYNRISETYKRLYFRDIQAVTLRETQRRNLIHWVLAALAGIGMLVVLLAALNGVSKGEAFIFAVLIVLIFGVPMLFNHLLGPTCECQMRTAVQTVDLPSLCRVRQTRRVLEKIRPLIVAAQGQLSVEDIAALMEESSASASTAPPTGAPSELMTAMPEGSPATGIAEATPGSTASAPPAAAAQPEPPSADGGPPMTA